MAVPSLAITSKVIWKSPKRIQVTAGTARADVSGATLTLAAATDMLIDATGGAATGLDTGAIAASTWYSVFLITGTVPGTSVILSASQAKPVLPSGYTDYAFVDFVRVGPDSQFAAGLDLEDAVGTASARARATGKLANRLVYQSTSASDSVTAVASNNVATAFAQTYSIPANTITVGTRVRIRAMVRVSNASGTDTLSVVLLIGAQALVTTTAVDPGATTDFHILEFDLVGRAVPGATASCVGYGQWKTNTGGTEAGAHAILAPTDLATNGALVVSATATWSSNTASTACLLEYLRVEID